MTFLPKRSDVLGGPRARAGRDRAAYGFARDDPRPAAEESCSIATLRGLDLRAACGPTHDDTCIVTRQGGSK
jgi:hypothetical protein